MPYEKEWYAGCQGGAMKFAGSAYVRDIIGEQRGIILSSLGSLALRLVGLGSSFLLGVVLARALGPQEYGIYGFVTSLAAVAMNLTLLGTPQLAVRELAIRAADANWPGSRSLARSLLTTTSVASVLLGVAATIVAAICFDRDPRFLRLTIVGAILATSMGATALIAAELRGVGRLLQGQFMDILGRPLAALLAIFLILLGGFRLSAYSALWVQTFVALIATAVSLAWVTSALHHDGQADDHREGWSWLRAALPLGVVDVLRQFDGTYGVILVGILGSALDLGIYRVAVASAVLVSMPVTILHIVLAPTLSRLHRFGQRAELQRLLRVASGGMCLLLVPMLGVLVGFGRPLVDLVFGTVYGDAWIPLALLCGAQLIFSFFGMGPILLAMADCERQLTVIYVVAVAAGVTAAAFLIPRFGAAGAAAAQVLSSGIVAGLSGVVAIQRLGLQTTFIRI
jgi:O-antigen/teichoic acid export membrane protein